MSRTYHKFLSMGICVGNNHDYYKKRRQNASNKRRQQLRNMSANFDPEYIDENIYTEKAPKRDTWDEPTDGRILIRNKKEASEWYPDYAKRKLIPKLRK